MKPNNILSWPAVIIMAVVITLWCGCGGPYIKLIDQPPIAQPNDTIGVCISVGTFGTVEPSLNVAGTQGKTILKMVPFGDKAARFYNMLYSREINSYLIFSVCIPDGFETDNPIPYRLDQHLEVFEGNLHYVNSISETMNSTYLPKPGYHWRSFAGDNPFIWGDRDISMTMKMILPEAAGDFFIDYAFGSAEAESFDTTNFQYMDLGSRMSTGHFLTTGEPEQYLVTSAAPGGPGSLQAALDSIVNYGVITFDLTQVPPVLQIPSLTTNRPFWIKGDEDQLLTLVVDGNLNFYGGEAPFIFSNISLKCVGSPSQPVIKYNDGIIPLIFENVLFDYNIRISSDLIRADYGNLSFTNCSFVHNQFQNLINANNQVTRITNCSFYGNEGYASIILIYSDIEICNTVFRDSICPMLAQYSSVIMKNISFAGRDPFELWESNLDLYNSVLWSAGSQIHMFPGNNNRSNVSHSNVKDSANFFFEPNWLEGNISEDPLFVASGDHWCQLQYGSPSIDAGTHIVPGWPVHHCDLAGNSRIQDGDGDGVAVIDMGAYEVESIGVKTPEFRVPGSGLQVIVFPNPLSGKATVQYTLENPHKVEIEIYSQLGQSVGYQYEGMKPAGTHQTSIDLSGLPAGLYFLRTSTIDHRQSAIHSGVV
ncbi:MAG: T9SS type A sorting domain-containing protein, partial [Bacteroidales bacterium]|nr:T9SS type A sorting domain-containing protein [Bacteroidales bacterium]